MGKTNVHQHERSARYSDRERRANNTEMYCLACLLRWRGVYIVREASRHRYTSPVNDCGQCPINHGAGGAPAGCTRASMLAAS